MILFAKKNLLKTICILFLAITPTFASTYYVNNGGNDHSNGKSDSSALLTVSKAIQKISCGDKIFLKKGSVFREMLSIKKECSESLPILVDAYGEGTLPVITGLKIIDTPWTKMTSIEEYSTPFKGPAKYVLKDGIKLTRGTKGILKEGEWDWSKEQGGILTVFSDPTNHIIESTALNHNVYMESSKYWIFQNIAFTYTFSTNITIQNNSSFIRVLNSDISNTGKFNIAALNNISNSEFAFNKIGYAGLYAVNIESGFNNLVHDNIISHSNHDGIMFQEKTSNSRIFLNDVSHCALQQGQMITVRGKNIEVDHNNVHDNLDATQYAGEGIDALFAENTKIHHNHVENTHSVGIYVDGSTGTEVYNNIVINPRSWGIAFIDETKRQPNANAKVFNNILIGNDPKSTSALVVTDHLRGHELNNVEFYNNTVIGFQKGISVAGNAHTGIIYKNNILYNASLCAVERYKSSTGVITDFNLYWPGKGRSACFNGINYRNESTDFEKYQTDSRQDLHSILADPLLTDNHKLNKNSPAIDAGDNISFIKNDYVEKDRPQGSHFDIGAFEHEH